MYNTGQAAVDTTDGVDTDTTEDNGMRGIREITGRVTRVAEIQNQLINII